MPSENTSSRRLAAILFCDIQGYTAMMQSDEGLAMSRHKRYQDVLKAEVAQHKGEIIKNYGDGSLCLFKSVLDAVNSAKAIQIRLQEDPKVPLRIGIHLGDVMYRDDDIYGNAVNVSSRIESMGVPGSILMSKNVYEKVKNQSSFSFESYGLFEFKNVDEPMEVFALTNEGLVVPKKLEMKGKIQNKNNSNYKLFLGISIFLLLLFTAYLYNQWEKKTTKNEASIETLINDKSIAVLPLKNLSGDKSLEYVCEGMTNAIILRLALIKDMDKVSSFTSILKYKNSDKGLREIAQEMEVSKILQGSFQKSGEQIQITLQLIEGYTDNQIWSHSYTYKWEPDDIFGIQATITETVAQLMNAEISSDEIASIQKLTTSSKEAYNLYLQAEYQRYKSNEFSLTKSIQLYEDALAIDPEFIEAYIGLAWVWSTSGLVWGIFGEEEAWSKTKSVLTKALEVDSSNTQINADLFAGSFYYDWNFGVSEPLYTDLLVVDQKFSSRRDMTDYAKKTGRREEALKIAESMISDRPNNGMSYFSKAEALYYLDREEEALNILIKADELYSDNQFYLREVARQYFYMKEYDRFNAHLELLMNNYTDRAPIHLWMNAVKYSLENDMDQVQKYLNILEEKYDVQDSGSPAWFLAMYYFSIDEIDSGFLWLKKSFDRHEVEMTWLQAEPLLQKVKNDERYLSIHQKMKWPKLFLD